MANVEWRQRKRKVYTFFKSLIGYRVREQVFWSAEVMDVLFGILFTAIIKAVGWIAVSHSIKEKIADPIQARIQV